MEYGEFVTMWLKPPDTATPGARKTDYMNTCTILRKKCVFAFTDSDIELLDAEDGSEMNKELKEKAALVPSGQQGMALVQRLGGDMEEAI